MKAKFLAFLGSWKVHSHWVCIPQCWLTAGVRSDAPFLRGMGSAVPGPREAPSLSSSVGPRRDSVF